MALVLKDPSLLADYPFLAEYSGRKDAPVEIGAVYFRRSNPPEEDWERDYRTARKDGHTMFRHWFTWNAVHVAPDTFDWEPYDKHLALAAQYGIKTIIAEHIYEAPDWLYHKYPHARIETADGNRHHSLMGHSNALGLTRMCLDNGEVAEEAGKFLFELARHYRDNPGLYGYDIWNECSLYNAASLCYCPATQGAFRLWLREKYRDDLDLLRNTWRRFSISGWEEIEMPRHIQPFPDTIDMVHFQNDNALKWMRFRRDTLRKADKRHYIVAHGNAKTFCDLPACGDDYRAAEFCDIFGYTFWYGNGCHTMLGSDMIRIAAAGREFWRAEAIGNSDWAGRGGHTTPVLKQEEMGDPRNIRLDAMYSFIAGSRAYINPRWRALQEGVLFDGYGWYNLDGSGNARTAEVAKIAAWANDRKIRELWNAQPLRGELGLLLLDDAEIFCYSFYGSTEYYSLAYQGAYEAFLDCNIQTDPIRLNHLEDYKIVYVPFPVSLSDGAAEKLIAWVERGGVLCAEGCPGYFSAGGHAYAEQPSRGLDLLIGGKQDAVSFGPDMWHGMEFSSAQGRCGGGVFRQSYLPESGRVTAWYDDGKAAVIENNYGKGRVRVVGTMAGYGYKLAPKGEYLNFFASLLPFAGKLPLIRSDYNSGLIARIWANKGDVFLWCVNRRPYCQEAVLELNDGCFSFSRAETIRGGGAQADGRYLRFAVPGRDAAVYRLV
jgi:beta-galactosidase